MLPILLLLVLPFTLRLGWVLPLFSPLALAYVLSFTTAGVDAARFNAVGMDVALPLYCGYVTYCYYGGRLLFCC